MGAHGGKGEEATTHGTHGGRSEEAGQVVGELIAEGWKQTRQAAHVSGWLPGWMDMQWTLAQFKGRGMRLIVTPFVFQ